MSIFEVHVYIECSDRQQRSGKRKYGYVLETQLKGQPYTVEGFGEAEGTYNHTVIQILIKALRRISQGRAEKRIYIHSDNTYILNTIQHKIPQWASNGYRGSTGSPWKDQELWEQLYVIMAPMKVKCVQGKKHAYSGWLLREMQKGDKNAI